MAPLRDNYTYDSRKLMNGTLLKIMAFRPKYYFLNRFSFFIFLNFTVQMQTIFGLLMLCVSFSLLSECVHWIQRPTHFRRVFLQHAFVRVFVCVCKCEYEWDAWQNHWCIIMVHLLPWCMACTLYIIIHVGKHTHTHTSAISFHLAGQRLLD